MTGRVPQEERVACTCYEAGRDPMCLVHGSFAGTPEPAGSLAAPADDAAHDKHDSSLQGAWRLAQERAVKLAAAEAALAEARKTLPEDTPELRHWLGSQDVIGTKTTAQIARFVHVGLRALAVSGAPAAPAEPPEEGT